MQRLVRRGLVLLGASTIAIGLAVPANAGTRHPAPADTITQRQDAEVSNQTKQTAIAIAPAVQVAPATNVGVLTFGGQSIKQANRNDADATAVNANATRQSLTQTQHAGACGRCKAGDAHGKQHAGKGTSQRQSGSVSNRTKQTAVAVAPAVQVAPATNVGVLTFGGRSIKQANHNEADATAVNLNATKQRLTQTQHARKPIDGKNGHGGKDHARKDHVRKGHAAKKCDGGKQEHARKGHDGKRHAGKGTSQRQTGSMSNRTKQTAVAVAPAVQVAPATNVGVLTFGGQSIKQANHNEADATAVNLNATDQDLTQGQFADG